MDTIDKPKGKWMDFKKETENMKTAISIVRVLEALGGKSVQKGNKIKFHCLGHEDKHPSLVIKSDLRLCNCPVCPFGGDIFKVVSLKLNLDFDGAKQWLKEKFPGDYSPTLSSASTSASKTPHEDIHRVGKEINQQIEETIQESTPHDRKNVPLIFRGERQVKLVKAWEDRLDRLKKLTDKEFLETKHPEIVPLQELAQHYGITFDTIKQFRLSYSEKEKRVQIPVFDDKEHLLALIGRATQSDQEARYRAPKKEFFDPSEELYWWQGVLANKEQIKELGLIVVEGFSDVWKLFENGYRNVCSIFGNSLSEAQCKKIIELCRVYNTHVTPFFDNDEGGRLGRKQTTKALIYEIPVRFVTFPDNLTDPKNFSKSQLDALFKRKT